MAVFKQAETCQCDNCSIRNLKITNVKTDDVKKKKNKNTDIPKSIDVIDVNIVHFHNPFEQTFFGKWERTYH